jgi:hypothetical protein
MEMAGIPTADGSTHGISASGPPNSFRPSHCRAPKTIMEGWRECRGIWCVCQRGLCAMGAAGRLQSAPDVPKTVLIIALVFW